MISEEEQTRILTSDTFYDFLSRSSKIVERALDEDYDVLVDYTMDVEANQYVPPLLLFLPIEHRTKQIKSNKSSPSTPNNGPKNDQSPPSIGPQRYPLPNSPTRTPSDPSSPSYYSHPTPRTPPPHTTPTE